jgi:AcrR family transcriptional regulator
MVQSSSKRLGGRSARVRAVVFDAVEALLRERPGDIPSIPEVAERSGVNKTSLYRRWGDIRTLLAEVAVDRLIRDQPIPTIGSVHDNLTAWAISIARTIGDQHSLSLLRIMTMAPEVASTPGDIMKTPLGRRLAELQAMLERGRDRGETVPTVGDVIEIVLSPLYMHALFLGPIEEPDTAARLVDRLFLLTRLEAEATAALGR